ncbi:YoaH family protein [Photobacterium sanguinicancri]|uniref:YoaH family protein n=1 Tax=Photobacterium sanguinicancri TaxID=875932 RepID=A0AAW7YBA9_9GAMM|nr:YoaH family protein [Photobacterium sanguinicancri]KXI21477.1 hypothetical protein AS132_20260 [Photobacterium sanguinicancri]MDO6499275.1 YoaH family protein [Photobacterium sanguinicancri]MDO6545190.1 YoaH family protein [Photobacterium sanguinicancri]OZS43326.1 YoaH family protein [Photobacterium sanguinicancri]
MFNSTTLTHAEQQLAAERIHELMASGMSSGEAIQIVANDIRESAAKAKAQQEPAARFEEE